MQTISNESLITSVSKKLDLIKFSTDGKYETDFLPVIKSLATWFNSLPLNLDLFDEPGGAFRCCIESTYFVMRQAKATIFTSDMTSDKRREFEPQYKYAAFIAGIVSWVDEPFRHFDLEVRNSIFNPTIHGGFGSFLGNEKSFEIKNKQQPLAESRQRTILLSSEIILPLMDKLSVKVQDDLISAINPERRPQSSESVLQRVVRKGLAQAEELERKSKQLLVNSQPRDVTTAFMVKQSADDVHSDGEAQVSENDQKEQPKVEATAPTTQPKKTPQEKFEEKQSRLPLDTTTLPKMPKQYQELLSALAHDIRTKNRDIGDTNWVQSGLLVPKKFFAGYGKSVAQVIEDLRTAEVIVGNDNLNVLICSPVGEMLVPRDAKNEG